MPEESEDTTRQATPPQPPDEAAPRERSAEMVPAMPPDEAAPLERSEEMTPPQPPDEAAPRERSEERVPAKPPEAPSAAETPEPGAGAGTFTFEHTFAFGEQLPLDMLPPEAIERVRSGGSLSEAELERLRTAALADSGVLGGLIGEALAAVKFETQDPGSGDVPGTAGSGSSPDPSAFPGSIKRFSWTWRSDDATPDAPADPAARTVSEPATYYEALSGRPDPMRDFFITGRRILNIGTWIIALGIPIGIVALAIATRQSFETIVFMGIAGFIVGMMFKSTFPKTPFG